MAEAGYQLEQVGIAGYPQSHPFINDDVTIQSMWDKRRFATYIVSQICFRPKVVAGWVRRLRRRGVDLPVHVGVPGPLDAARLVRISSRIGVEESARFARRHVTWLPHLLRVGGYNPSELVQGLAETLADPRDRVAGFHFYHWGRVRLAGQRPCLLHWPQHALQERGVDRRDVLFTHRGSSAASVPASALLRDLQDKPNRCLVGQT